MTLATVRLGRDAPEQPPAFSHSHDGLSTVRLQLNKASGIGSVDQVIRDDRGLGFTIHVGQGQLHDALVGLFAQGTSGTSAVDSKAHAAKSRESKHRGHRSHRNAFHQRLGHFGNTHQSRTSTHSSAHRALVVPYGKHSEPQSRQGV